jgi:hypothetical protein
MAAPEVPMKPLIFAAGAIVLVLALAGASVFGLLRLWQLPPGGTPVHGARAMAGRAGPRLQSAPQLEGAAYRAAKARELAASEARR